MRPLLRLLSITCLTTMLAGCLRESDRYVVNPDGSGKVAHRAVLRLRPEALPAGARPTPLAQRVLTAVRAELDHAKGVETWSDVAFRQVDAGVEFSATAYFPALDAVAFHNSGIGEGGVVRTLTRDDQGRPVLTLRRKEPTGAPAKAVTLGEKELAERVQQVRMEEQASRPMLQGVLKDYLLTLDFTLGVPPVSATGFSDDGRGTLGFAVRGQLLLALTDAALADEAFIRREILAGREKDLTTRYIDEHLFATPYAAVFPATTAPAFAYREEAASAAKALPAALAALGLGAKTTATTGAP